LLVPGAAQLALPWNEDPPAQRRLIESNITTAVRRIRDAAVRRDAPTVTLAQQWHRDIYRGVPLPVPYYAGEIRDSDQRFPELVSYEVAVGALRGVAAADVPLALQQFQDSMQIATRAVDSVLGIGLKPPSARELLGVVQLGGEAHGEWIRIHPFANGNGRTARLWVAWVAARYGLPLFLRLKPRPDGTTYAIAASWSMLGDHRPMQLYLGDLLTRALAPSA
jgi:fido (protein-threonine AMPylation protein)